MLDTDRPFLLQISDESEDRVLHAGRIIHVQDNLYTGELDEGEEPSLRENESAFIYWEESRTFMQQAARISSIVEDGSKLTICFETMGDPVSAESRECYRVSTLRLGLTVAVGDEDDCPLLDASASGILVTTRSCLKLGDEVPVSLRYEGRQFSGKVIVQSVRDLGTGRIRHGLYAVHDRRSGGNLQQGLQLVSASVQRLLIKRMARV